MNIILTISGGDINIEIFLGKECLFLLKMICKKPWSRKGDQFSNEEFDLAVYSRVQSLYLDKAYLQSN